MTACPTARRWLPGADCRRSASARFWLSDRTWHPEQPVETPNDTKTRRGLIATAAVGPKQTFNLTPFQLMLCPRKCGIGYCAIFCVTEKNWSAPGSPFALNSPISLNCRPEPTTRSRTVRDTTIWQAAHGLASATRHRRQRRKNRRRAPRIRQRDSQREP